jgi:hypothetical protein
MSKAKKKAPKKATAAATEKALQCGIVRTVRGNYSSVMILSIPMGNRLSPQARGIAKNMGALAGAPDLVLAYRGEDGRERILWCEVKTDDGVLSDEQEEFAIGVQQRGGRYAVARSVEDVEGVLKELGVVPNHEGKRR